MKDFLKYTLATIVGILIVSVVCSFLMFAMLGVVMSLTQKNSVIENNSVLQLKLDETIIDRGINDPLQDLDIPGLSSVKKIGLNDIVNAINKSAVDDNIKGIVLRLENVNAGYSTCEEIRKALSDFKQSGKFIYAYSEMYSQKAYFLASVADKVFITPEGMLEFSGISSSSMYYKKALEKLGIEMQIIRHGRFKAAVEPFMLDKMSDENRKQIEVYSGSIWSNVVKAISESRGISVDRLNEIADRNMTYNPVADLLEYGLVDSIIYEDQFLNILRNQIGIEANEGVPVARVSDLKGETLSLNAGKDKIAVMYASGEIYVGGSASVNGDEYINSRDLAREIRLARADSSIKAIVLRVNSPGGSALGSELIWREVKLTSEVKPVVVSMGHYAASGGYYIASAANAIVATPSTITGSIGVFGMVPNTQKLFNDKLGINVETVNTNKSSDMPNVFRPLSDFETAKVQKMVDETYYTFVSHVADGRKMTFARVDSIGEGRVWTGANALDLGLVDALGDKDKAVAMAAEMADLNNFTIVELPKQKDPFSELMGSIGGSVRSKVIEKELGSMAVYCKTIEKLKTSEGIMTRLPFGMDLD